MTIPTTTIIITFHVSIPGNTMSTSRRKHTNTDINGNKTNTYIHPHTRTKAQTHTHTTTQISMYFQPTMKNMHESRAEKKSMTPSSPSSRTTTILFSDHTLLLYAGDWALNCFRTGKHLPSSIFTPPLHSPPTRSLFAPFPLRLIAKVVRQTHTLEQLAPMKGTLLKEKQQQQQLQQHIHSGRIYLSIYPTINKPNFSAFYSTYEFLIGRKDKTEKKTRQANNQIDLQCRI